MNCPTCHRTMEQGWLVIHEPLLPITRLVWQPLRPGSAAQKQLEEAVTVLQPRMAGKGCPSAFISKPCKITLFSYDEGTVT